MSRLIGAHVSISGGYHHAVQKVSAMGGTALQIFAVSPMARAIPTITDDQLQNYTAICDQCGIQKIYFHASYMVNFANDNHIGDQSVKMLTRELTFASRLKVKGSIIHLGSFKQKEEGLFDNQSDKFLVLINNIKRVLENTPSDTIFIAENAGNRKIGRDLQELARIVHAIGNNRLKICLDTCHLYSAGYDIVNPQKTDELLTWFDTHIGLDRLEVIHLNDSLDPLGSFRDRHENIGKGTIGLSTFEYWVNHPLLKDKVFILEVPGLDKKGPDKPNIDLVKSLVK